MSISSPASNLASSPSSSSTSSPLVSFSHKIGTKLDDSNFLLWRQQIVAAVRGHGLEKFLGGETLIPQSYLTDDDRIAERLNPEYVSWQKQDQLLLSWLFASLGDSMLRLAVGCSRSFEVWDKIIEYFGNHMAAKIHQYQAELRNTKKGTRPINEYLIRIKALVDQLQTIGSEVSEAEHIRCILEGLPEEYGAFMTSVNLCSEPLSIFALHSLLITQEIQIAKLLKPADSPISANVATHGDAERFNQFNPNAGRFPYRGNFRGNNLCGGRFQSNFRGSHSNNFRGGRGFGSYQRPPIQCELCNKSGHVAATCYQLPNFAGASSSFSRPSFTPQFLAPNPISGSMSAMIATPATLQDNAWFPDSRASAHLTNNSSNLMNSDSYIGNEQVYIGEMVILFLLHMLVNLLFLLHIILIFIFL